MGSRGYRGGDECDAFTRYARGIRGWKRGELRLVKRRFWKRDRKLAHLHLQRANETNRGGQL